jgi:hypothetical protein
MTIKSLFFTTATLLTTFAQASVIVDDVNFNVHVQAGAVPGGEGSEGKPFATLAAARDFLRTVEKPDGAVFRVLIGDGIYFLDKPLEFDARDSGPVNGAILYMAAEGASPVLSGGSTVTGWKEGENGIWNAEVGKMRFRQIYVAGRSCTRARFPNADEFFRIEKPNIKERFVTIGTPFARNWEQFDKVEMHVTMLWAEAILRLKSFQADPKSPEWTQVRFREPESELVFKRLWPRFVPHQAYHFENAREFIDQPGEWYLDERAGKLYYMPRPGEDMNTAQVIVPSLETLVRIEGTVDKPVERLHFAGLRFSHTNWLRPSDYGQLHMQAGQYTVEPTVENDQFVERIPASVSANHARGLRFRDNIFSQLGNHALDFHVGVTKSEILGNIFYDVAASGIVLGVFSPPGVEIHTAWNPQDPREITRNIRIANNYIRRIGSAYPGSCGIAAGFVAEMLIENNELTELPYTGISVGWGWTREPSALRANIIRRNLVHNLMRDLTDGGGVYTLSLQPGTQISENYVHGARLTPKSHDPFSLHSRGIYLDECSGGTAGEPFIVRRNLIMNCTQDFREHITGAVLIDSPLNYMEPAKHMSQFPPGKVIAESAGLEPEYRNLKKKLKFDTPLNIQKIREVLSPEQKAKNLSGEVAK